MAKKAEQKNRFAHLTDEQCVEKMMETNRVYWNHIIFDTLDDGDERGRMMQSLLTTLREADLAPYHADHCLIDEDEAPRKENKLRCKFWDEHYEMVAATVLYAEYCGYITLDRDAIMMENEEIEAKYEALKPRDPQAVVADGPESAE